jgi:hypothetical protein
MSRKIMEQCNAQKHINRIIDFLPTNRQFQYIGTVNATMQTKLKSQQPLHWEKQEHSDLVAFVESNCVLRYSLCTFNKYIRISKIKYMINDCHYFQYCKLWFKESCGLRHNINIGNVHFKGNLCSLSLDSKLLKILGSMYLLYRMII